MAESPRSTNFWINLLFVELCFIKHKMESCVQGVLLAVASGVVRYDRVFDSGELLGLGE